jgi:hypothetical protein
MYLNLANGMEFIQHVNWTIPGHSTATLSQKRYLPLAALLWAGMGGSSVWRLIHTASLTGHHDSAWFGFEVGSMGLWILGLEFWVVGLGFGCHDLPLA